MSEPNVNYGTAPKLPGQIFVQTSGLPIRHDMSVAGISVKDVDASTKYLLATPELEAAREMRWRSIANELPEDRQIVLAYAPLGMGTGIVKARFYQGDEFNKQHFLIIGGTQGAAVSHWMPLPQIPKQ